MPNSICTACGSQFAESAVPPPKCPRCEDARQFVPESGQGWTTLEALRRSRRNSYLRHEPNLIGIGTEPSFAIGQRALLVRTPGGNVLWDCVTFIDDVTIELISALGGIRAIAISHPHYYSSMVEWSRAFGAPVHLHAADREWVMRPDPAIQYWEGERLSLGDGFTLVRCGGHFAGGTVLHWRDGAEGLGALLTGDIVQVSADRKSVSFMYSYPNFIPLSAQAVEQIASAVAPFAFDRLYGAWWDRLIARDAKQAVARSAARYIDIVRETKS
jgi:glyoxylase-like metal-dependent hydrolase (beta-lactamase superfamily II)